MITFLKYWKKNILITFDFSDIFKTEMTFDEFIQIFLSAIDSEKNYDYAIFQFNKETKIIISHKSIDENSNIILSASNEKKE